MGSLERHILDNDNDFNTVDLPQKEQWHQFLEHLGGIKHAAIYVLYSLDILYTFYLFIAHNKIDYLNQHSII